MTHTRKNLKIVYVKFISTNGRTLVANLRSVHYCAHHIKFQNYARLVCRLKHDYNFMINSALACVSEIHISIYINICLCN